MSIKIQDKVSSRAGAVRSPTELAGGLLLLAMAGFAWWATGDLTIGTRDAVGAGLVPRLLSVGLGLAGLGLVARSFWREEPAGAGLSWRGPLFVSLAILVFALTIRPFRLPGFETPGLGLLGAGPLAVFIGGLADEESDPVELLALAFGLTGFCMVLFGDILGLQIPMFPKAMQGAMPPGAMLPWVTPAVLILLGAGLGLLARQRHHAKFEDVR